MPTLAFASTGRNKVQPAQIYALGDENIADLAQKSDSYSAKDLLNNVASIWD